MTAATKQQHLARLRQLRDEMYAKLPPEKQRRINEARQTRADWIAWRIASRSKQADLTM